MQSKANAVPRRTKVGKRYPGIYKSCTGLYEACYQGSDGKTHWKGGFATVRDAVEFRAEVAVQKKKGVKVAPTRKTFDEVASLWLESKKIGTRTRILWDANLRNHLLPELGRKRVAEISEDDIVRLIRKLEKGGNKSERKNGKPLSPWTIQSVLTVFSGVMKFAIRRGWASRNPLETLEKGERPSMPKSEPRPLDDDEQRAFLAATPETYKPLIAVALGTGLRISELLGLQWGDIDTKAKVVHVRRALSQRKEFGEPKHGSRREVILFDDTAQVLREYKLRSRYTPDEDLVFCTSSGKPLNQRNVRRDSFEVARERSGIDIRGFHNLRDSFASALIFDGADVAYVQRQMGHRSPQVTWECYISLFNRRDQDARVREAREGRLERTWKDDDRREPQTTAEQEAEIVVLTPQPAAV